MSDLSQVDFNALTPAQFEEVLPDLFTGGGKVSEDPRLQKFFAANPDAAALVRDLETIADTARNLFEPTHEPSDGVWDSIASKLQAEPLNGEAVDLSE